MMTVISADPSTLRGFARRFARRGHALVNGRRLEVEWTARAERALQARTTPLIVEMELYFSCLVRKTVRFRDDGADRTLDWVDRRLAVCFRPVTSTACSIEQAMSEGRQPETEITGPAAARFAPKRLTLDFRGDRWLGEYQL